jgi:putative addiction module component (TIGR02574 family)
MPTAIQNRHNPTLSRNLESCTFSGVPMTLEQIVEETRHWPPEKVGELVGRLTENLHASDPEIEAAWKTEVDRRVEEIQSGKVQGIPGEEVSARIRKILGR